MKIDIENMVLTDRAVRWVTKFGKPVCASDFIGYLFDLGNVKSKFRGIGASVDVFGEIHIFSLNKKKPFMSDRKCRSVYKQLLKLDFITIDDCPFDEFKGKPINIDYDKAVFVEAPVFMHSP